MKYSRVSKTSLEKPILIRFPGISLYNSKTMISLNQWLDDLLSLISFLYLIGFMVYGWDVTLKSHEQYHGMKIYQWRKLMSCFVCLFGNYGLFW